MEELRQVATLRLTQMLHYQTINLSLFGFYSPDDEVTLTVGGNLFGGDRPYTLFSQFEDNSNLYTRVRYYF
ncbi:hypothetical protein ACFL60_08030 [Candidatus Omnitrophota bacterium]